MEYGEELDSFLDPDLHFLASIILSAALRLDWLCWLSGAYLVLEEAVVVKIDHGKRYGLRSPSVYTRQLSAMAIMAARLPLSSVRAKDERSPISYTSPN